MSKAGDSRYPFDEGERRQRSQVDAVFEVEVTSKNGKRAVVDGYARAYGIQKRDGSGKFWKEGPCNS